MDPRNGGILALVSRPGYDPNPFVDGIGSGRAYERRSGSPEKAGRHDEEGGNHQGNSGHGRTRPTTASRSRSRCSICSASLSTTWS